MNVFLWNARARNSQVEATLNHPFAAQVARKRLNRLRSSDAEKKKRQSSKNLTKTDDASSCFSCDSCFSSSTNSKSSSKKPSSGSGLRL